MPWRYWRQGTAQSHSPSSAKTTFSSSLPLTLTLLSNNSHSILHQEVMASGQVSDGTVAQSQSQTDMMWRVREGISEACGKRGARYTMP